MVNFTLKDKVVIVTGASSGIGAAIARDLSSRGCRLALCGRDHQRLVSTMEACLKQSAADGLNQPQDQDFLLIVADLARDDEVEKVVNMTVQHFGRVDVLVNNAGVARLHTIDDLTMDEFRQVMRVNLDAPVYLSKLCTPHLEATKGCIINISSNASVCPFAGSLAYSVSKTGVDQLTKCLALELAPRGIRVNAVNPGLVPTEIFKNAGVPDFVVDQIVADRNAVTCLGRCGRLDDVTNVIRFLASPAAGRTTGAVLMVNGGWHNQTFKYDSDVGYLTDDNTNLADLKNAQRVTEESRGEA